MLSYPMCKRLSEAGYPQNGKYYWEDHDDNTKIFHHPGEPVRMMAECSIRYSCPSLSELLDEIEKVECKWHMIHVNDDYTILGERALGQGATAAEAAAELWLKLKEKQNA